MSAWASLPIAISPFGIKTMQSIWAFAEYAAAEAEVLPVDAQMTARVPSSRAFETATVIPLSLNEQVGFNPSYFKYILKPPPMDSPKLSAAMSGVLPSLRVITGVFSVTGR